MNAFLKLLYFYIIKIITSPLRLLPVKKNRILFTGLTGGTANEYTCNPKYMCQYVMEQAPGQYEIYWAVSDPDKYGFLEKQGIKLVKHFSLSSYSVFLTAGVIVSSGSYAPTFPFRKSQYFINTWHGGGCYKKIENTKPDANRWTRKRAQICAENIKLFVSTCQSATQHLIRETFLYKGEVLEVGMPRNDMLVNGDTKAGLEQVRKTYGLGSEDRIVLFAPTYRPEASTISLDAGPLMQTLEQDGHKWHFMRRAHRYSDGYQIKVTGTQVLEAGDYPDMQELLCGADVLITDYSSCIWDYSFLYRPCYLYTPDLESYRKNTGFYNDIDTWPFPCCESVEALCQAIEQYDSDKNRQAIHAHHKLLGNCETGKACEYVYEKILEVTT